MPSNQTQNYQLNQWEPGDQVLRVDFNKDNEKIDAAIKKVDVRVDGKADVSALEKLTATVNSLSGTVSGQGNTLTAKGNCQIVATSYIGKGAFGSKNACSLSFSAQPLLVIVLDQGGYPLVMLRPSVGARSNGGAVAVSWNSLGVSWYSGTGDVAQLNILGQTYNVVALLSLS